MKREIPIPDPPLTRKQQAKVDQLSEAQIQTIDRALLSKASHRWQKVAKIVGFTMSYHSDAIPNIPDIFYASRIRKLVEIGCLESEGDLRCMRFSEVRLPITEKQIV